MPDFIGANGSLSATGGYNITPSDTTLLAPVTRALSWAGAGDLVVQYIDGINHTIPSGALATGIMHPLQVRRVLATGTTATGIVGFF